MPTPKQRFLRTQHAEPAANMLATITFEEASDAAILQFIEELGIVESVEMSAARNWKREGALRFLEILKTIGKAEQPPPDPITSNLKSL